MEASMEHRWGDRVAIDVPVRISSNGATGSGTLRNISVSGAFIETALPLSALTMVRIVIPRSPDTGRARADARGFVVRRDRNGIGIEWCERAPMQAVEVKSLSWHSVSRHRNVATPRRITIS
jgi:ribosomal protein L19